MSSQVSITFVDNFFLDSAAGSEGIQLVPHLGLASLAAVLEEAGHHVHIFDPKLFFFEGLWTSPSCDFFSSCAEVIASQAPSVVGFTSYGCSFPYALEIAQSLKEISPTTPIILGGPHATIVGESILRSFNEFDIVAERECEPIIVELVESVVANETIERIPNVLFKVDGEIRSTNKKIFTPDVDQLPYPSLDHYPIKRYRLRELPIEAGRGCPFPCTFCSTSNFFQRKYRVKSTSRLIGEMCWAHREFGVSAFNLNHDLFGLRKQNVLEFCEQVEELNFNWRCSMRPDTVDQDLLQKMKRAGCDDIFFGLESGSDRIQKSIKKRLNVREAVRRSGEAINAGIGVTASFITGFPDEERPDLDLSLDTIGELMAQGPSRVNTQLHMLAPEPGSHLGSLREFEMAFDGIGSEFGERAIDESRVAQYPSIFSVFYHFESALDRWAVVLSSAFVLRLVPVLSAALVVHITSELFEGKLSRFFAAVVPAKPKAKLEESTIESVLIQGLNRWASNVPSSHEYLADLLRFARTSHALQNAPLNRLPSDSTKRTSGMVEISFKRRVTELLAHIRECPTQPVPPAIAMETRESLDFILVNTLGRGVRASQIEKGLDDSSHYVSNPHPALVCLSEEDTVLFSARELLSDECFLSSTRTNRFC